MNIEQIKASNDLLALAQAWYSARSMASQKKRKDDSAGAQWYEHQRTTIEERWRELTQSLNTPNQGLNGSSIAPEFYETKSEVRILNNELERYKNEVSRLERYRDENERLKDELRDMKRDKQDLEHQLGKRSMVQEIFEGLKDPDIKKPLLGLMSKKDGEVGLSGLNSEVKKSLGRWLQECEDDEAHGIYTMLILGGEQYNHAEEFNNEIGPIIQKHMTALEQQAKTTA